MIFIAKDGVPIYLERIGRGPPILTMHGGLGLDHTVLRPWHDELAHDHSLIYYDHRGSGRSRCAQTIKLTSWYEDAVALLDGFGEQRAIILGHSYGAWLALGLGIQYPERVSGLVLSGAFCAFDYSPEVFARLLRRDPALAVQWLSANQRLPASDSEFQQRWAQFLPFYFHTQPRSDAFDKVRYSASGFRAGASYLTQVSLCSKLASLKMPVLLLVGSHDLVTPADQAWRIARAVPSATVVEFSHSAHFPFIEEPIEYLNTVRRWLKRNG